MEQVSIIALIGFLATMIAVITPIIKLNTTIQKLNDSVEALNKVSTNNQIIIEEHDKKLNDHEIRITLLENKKK